MWYILHDSKRNIYNEYWRCDILFLGDLLFSIKKNFQNELSSVLLKQFLQPPAHFRQLFMNRVVPPINQYYPFASYENCLCLRFLKLQQTRITFIVMLTQCQTAWIRMRRRVIRRTTRI